MSERDLENIELIADAVNDAEDEERAIIAINLLPVNYAKWIYQKFPRANYADTRSWIEALKSSAIPRILRIQAGAVRLELSSHKIRIKKATGACKSMQDMIKRDERINSEIDKCIKRLAMIKTLKQVMHVQESQTKAIEQKASSDLA